MSSKRRQRRKECGHKRQYSTLDSAISAAWHARRRCGEWIVAYKCTFAAHWHVGHATYKHRQAVRAKRERQI